MLWFAIIAAVLLLLIAASLGRRGKQREAIAGLRDHFPAIVRMRLIAACPGLDPVLQETELRLLFDWILLQMYRRTNSPGFGELMRWTVEHGETESNAMVANVTRDAVDRLPSPVLQVIDGCQGRVLAAVILDEALSEAGERIGPELKRKYV